MTWEDKEVKKKNFIYSMVSKFSNYNIYLCVCVCVLYYKWCRTNTQSLFHKSLHSKIKNLKKFPKSKDRNTR